MKKIILYTLTILLTSCQGNIYFTSPQPTFEDNLSMVPKKFQGVFSISYLDTTNIINISNTHINSVPIDSDSLVLKQWGNYLFVNKLKQKELWSLEIITMNQILDYESITHHPILFDDWISNYYNYTCDTIEDVPIYILEDPNVLEFQYLIKLNEASTNLIRIDQESSSDTSEQVVEEVIEEESDEEIIEEE